MTTLPLDFPPLREGAEEMAREYHAARCAVGGPLCPGPWEMLFPSEQANRTAAFARLLADLTRPASRDWWVRWLARHHGEKVATTAPAWIYVAAVASREHRTIDGEYIDHDDGRPAMWLLICDEGAVSFAQWDPNDGPTPTEGGEGVDVWLTDWSRDPAEALALACLAAVG